MSDVARTTGRGFLVITAAKVWFMVSGTLISLGLPSLFDAHPDQGAAAFGVYSVVINLVSIFNMVMITGTLQAVAKIVSEDPTRSGAVVRRAIRAQLALGVPIGLAFLLSAPLFAGALNDSALAPYLRLSSGVVLSYSFYAIFVGYFNGRKEFTRQATLDIVFATLKAVLILGLVFVGLGVLGAIGGFVITSIVLMVAAGLWVWRLEGARAARAGEGGAASVARGEGAEPAGSSRMVWYMLTIMAYTFFLNGIIRADLFILKSTAGGEGLMRAAQTAFGGVEAATAGFFGEVRAYLSVPFDAITLSNRLSGVYGAMQNIARLPYQAVIAITFVIFPIISRSTFEGDRAASRLYIRQTLRYSLILVASMVAVLIADRDALVFALYPDEYASGGDALLWLGLAMMGFALMYVATTILISAGRPLTSMGIAGLTLAASAIGNYLWLNGVEVGWPMLDRAGEATCVATWIGFLAACVVLFKRFDAALPLGTLARVAAASAVLVVLAQIIPMHDILGGLGGGRLVRLAIVGGKMAVFGVLFYVLLYALREFGDSDKARLRSVLARRKRVKED
jgi:stage V sporulation protein B